MEKREYLEKERKINVVEEVDVIVAGGGPAGISAAVAASREGASVILIEKNGFLTGAHASCHVGTFCGVFYIVNDKVELLVRGFTETLLNELKKVGALNEPFRFGNTAVVTYDPLWFKQISEDLVLNSGSSIIYHSRIVDVMIEDGKPCGVIIESKSGREAIRGKIIIDATGDADIVAFAGGDYSKGHNGFLQYPSTNFRIANVNEEKANELSLNDIQEIMKKAVSEKEIDLPRTDGFLFKTPRGGERVCNVTTVSKQGEIIDGTNKLDLTYAEIEGKRQARKYEEFFRKYLPGFENIFIEDTGETGIRETRIIEGMYKLKNQDVTNAKKFNDAVARSAWPIEQHSLDVVKLVWIGEGDFYEIPFRCLIPRNIDNVLVAGRCISAEQEAQASVRVAAQCFAFGEAAGIASAMAIEQNTSPSKLNGEEVRRRLIQKNANL